MERLNEAYSIVDEAIKKGGKTVQKGGMFFQEDIEEAQQKKAKRSKKRAG